MGTILRNYIHGTAVTTNRALRERGVLLQSGVALALSLKSGYKDRANPESLRCLVGKASKAVNEDLCGIWESIQTSWSQSGPKKRDALQMTMVDYLERNSVRICLISLNV